MGKKSPDFFKLLQHSLPANALVHGTTESGCQTQNTINEGTVFATHEPIWYHRLHSKRKSDQLCCVVISSPFSASFSVLSPHHLSSLDMKLKGGMDPLTALQKPGCAWDIWSLLALKSPPETDHIYDAIKKNCVLGRIVIRLSNVFS